MVTIKIQVPGYKGGTGIERTFNVNLETFAATLQGEAVPIEISLPDVAKLKPLRFGTQVSLVMQNTVVAGQPVSMNATGFCSGKPIDGVNARFYVNGELVSSSKMENGSATATWVPTDTGASHKVCVEVDGFDDCDPGRDCKVVKVIEVFDTETLERLKKEREVLEAALKEQRERRRLAHEIIESTSERAQSQQQEISVPIIKHIPSTGAIALPPVSTGPGESLGKVVVDVRMPPGMRGKIPHILVDGHDEGPPPLTIRLRQGVHIISAVVNGKRIATTTVDVRPGKMARVKLGV